MIETSGHLPECPVEQGTDYSGKDASVVWSNGTCICSALRACEQRVILDALRPAAPAIRGTVKALADALNGAKDEGYAAGRRSMSEYLLADDTHSYTYGYAAGLDAARDAVADVRASLTFLGAVVVMESINRDDALAAIDALRGDA